MITWTSVEIKPELPIDVIAIEVIVCLKYGSPKIICYGDFGYGEPVYCDGGLIVESITHWSNVNKP